MMMMMTMRLFEAINIIYYNTVIPPNTFRQTSFERRSILHCKFIIRELLHYSRLGYTMIMKNRDSTPRWNDHACESAVIKFKVTPTIFFFFLPGQKSKRPALISKFVVDFRPRKFLSAMPPMIEF